MSQIEWKALLLQWSKDALASVYAKELPSEVRESGWLGCPGASEAQIAHAEARLEARLPPSYRAFLAVSDGFYLPGGLVPRLVAAREIEWFRIRDPETVSAWTRPTAPFRPTEAVPDDEYFVYGEEQDTCSLRPEYLETALQVSERERAGTAVYLLNPQVTTDTGEWEAWYFAHWLPGAARYRSFWELMQAEYRSFLSTSEREGQRSQPGDSSQVLAGKLSSLVHELQHRMGEWTGILAQRQTEGWPGAAGYEQGIVDGLKYAEAQVQGLMVQARRSDIVHEQLSALADELETQWQQRVQKAQGLSALSLLLSGGMGEFLHSSGVAEGYREAEGAIRWFLNER